MKLFTLEDANELLPTLTDTLEAIRALYKSVEKYQPEARAAAQSSQSGGGMVGGTHYVNALYEIGKRVTELSEIGVELKDHSTGLIDFPSLRDGRVVLLCWRLGEGETIKWWHEIDGGFSARKPI